MEIDKAADFVRGAVAELCARLFQLGEEFHQYVGDLRTNGFVQRNILLRCCGNKRLGVLRAPPGN